MSLLKGVVIGLGVLLVLGLLFVWFALPPILGGVAVGILRDNGVQAGDMRVDIGADPPLRLISLEADRVRVRATDVEIRTLRADSVDLTFRGVSLREQTFDAVEGRLEGARLTPDEGPTVQITSVQLSGPPENALMTLALSEADVGALVRSTIARAFGADADNVDLESPDRLAFDVSGQRVGGRLSVNDAGSLMFVDDLGQMTLELFRSTPLDQATLRSVRVEDETLEVTGTVNLLAGR